MPRVCMTDKHPDNIIQEDHWIAQKDEVKD